MQRDSNRSRSNSSIRSMASNSSDVDTSEFEDNSEFSPDSDDNDTSRHDDDVQSKKTVVVKKEPTSSSGRSSHEESSEGMKAESPSTGLGGTSLQFRKRLNPSKTRGLQITINITTRRTHDTKNDDVGRIQQPSVDCISTQDI
uniref:Uncharacterized protein n=1 Tax=Daphnia galeata TaxID=27404 RepID=A0A8J2WH88_9CRUS|nr:unnamed protein product [Daphnia galeata]